jgi:hypothetical protein
MSQEKERPPQVIARADDNEISDCQPENTRNGNGKQGHWPTAVRDCEAWLASVNHGRREPTSYPRPPKRKLWAMLAATHARELTRSEEMVLQCFIDRATSVFQLSDGSTLFGCVASASLAQLIRVAALR